MWLASFFCLSKVNENSRTSVSSLRRNGEEKNAGNEDGDKQSVVEVITFIADQVDEMIYREENILLTNVVK
jgi:DUF438 domain-containing protein